MKKNLYEDNLIQVDFDEFDEVVLNGSQLIATKTNGSNFDDESLFDVGDDIGDFDEEPVGALVSDEPELEEPLTDEELVGDEEIIGEEAPTEQELTEIDESCATEQEELDECAGAMTDEEIKASIEGKGKGVTECAGALTNEEYEAELAAVGKKANESAQPKGRSLADLYESRQRRQRNKLVESLLVDNTVQTIEDVLTQTLKAHGISKAESIVTIGLILDRMLNASDDDVAAPEFLDGIINQLVDNKDIQKIVKGAVENALEGKEPLPAPGLVDVDDVVKVVSSEKDGKPVSYGEVVKEKDEPEEE